MNRRLDESQGRCGLLKGKGHPRTGHEGLDGEQWYSSTLYLTSALIGVGGQRHAPATLPSEKDPVPILQEAGWASGPVWTGAKNLTSTGIRSSDRSVRSESLYGLSYTGPNNELVYTRRVYAETYDLFCTIRHAVAQQGAVQEDAECTRTSEMREFSF